MADQPDIVTLDVCRREVPGLYFEARGGRRSTLRTTEPFWVTGDRGSRRR